MSTFGYQYGFFVLGRRSDEIWQQCNRRYLDFYGCNMSSERAQQEYHFTGRCAQWPQANILAPKKDGINPVCHSL